MNFIPTKNKVAASPYFLVLKLFFPIVVTAVVFGTPGPAKAGLYGIDVYQLQWGISGTNINWSLVASSGGPAPAGPKSFTWVKASEGVQYKELNWETNITAAASAHIKAGAFHLARPVQHQPYNTGAQEADSFLDYANAKAYIVSGYLRPALDIEDVDGTNESPLHQLLPPGGPGLAQRIQDWCSRVVARTGVTPVIYMTKTYAQALLNYPALAQYPLWIATDSGDPSYNPTNLGPWGNNWAFQQYGGYNNHACASCVPGISTIVDLDYFPGDAAALNAYVIGGGAIGDPTITAVSPTSITIGQGGTFPITYTINAAGPGTILLGASLYPFGQTSGRIDASSHDTTVTLSAGQNTVQRQFTVPANAASGSYDLVVGLWNDVNGNGVIDPNVDREITEYKNANAVTIQTGGGCSYSLYPVEFTINSGNGASSSFTISTSSTCGWTATPSASWITLTGLITASGSGTVTFSVAANTSASARQGTITVQDQTFTITQSGGSSTVTVSDVQVGPPSSRPGLTPQFYANITSSVSQSVLLGATIYPTNTSTAYVDPNDDKKVTLAVGTGQWYRSFALPVDLSPGTYDVQFEVWADTNGNGHVDSSIDTLLGSFRAYGALTVQPAIGSVQGFIVPNDAVAAGGNWRIDGGNWTYTGSTLGGFAVGNHTVNFKLAPGWTKPPDQIVPVQANQTTQVTGTYAPIALGNISTRLSVGTGENVLIGGFIINGTQPKKVIVRAIGPSLTQFGLSGVLADPTLELHDGSGALIATNDNWQTTQIGGIITADQVSDIQNSGLAPTQAAESAIIATLPPGGYTAIVRGTNNTTGIALVESYDLDRTVDSKLANISTRGLVQTGENVMIGGLIIQGSDTATVIIRAIGPSLANAGILNPLVDPTLELHDGSGALIASNDNWQTTQIGGIITADQVSAIQSSDLAPTQAAESAIIVTLQPGGYTAIVRGTNNTTGVALIEAYQLGN